MISIDKPPSILKNALYQLSQGIEIFQTLPQNATFDCRKAPHPSFELEVIFGLIFI
jgi:hypothetical protein